MVPPPENQHLLPPIELESLSRRKVQGNEHVTYRPVSRPPFFHLPTHAVVGPLIAAPLQFLKQQQRTPALPRGPCQIRREQLLQVRQERP